MITEKDILKTANLAKLEISHTQMPFYIDGVNKILCLMDDIDVSTEEHPSENAVDFRLLREDETKPSLGNSQILSNTKDTEDGFFVLRKQV